MHCSTRGFSVHYEFPELAQTHVHQVCDVIQPSHSLWSPSIVPNIRVFSNESVFHIRWPKYWSFSISPSSEYSRLISFMIDWFDLAVQGTLRSLHQPHSSSLSCVQMSEILMRSDNAPLCLSSTFLFAEHFTEVSSCEP